MGKRAEKSSGRVRTREPLSEQRGRCREVKDGTEGFHLGAEQQGLLVLTPHRESGAVQSMPAKTGNRTSF